MGRFGEGIGKGDVFPGGGNGLELLLKRPGLLPGLDIDESVKKGLDGLAGRSPPKFGAGDFFGRRLVDLVSVSMFETGDFF